MPVRVIVLDVEKTDNKVRRDDDWYGPQPSFGRNRRSKRTKRAPTCTVLKQTRMDAMDPMNPMEYTIGSTTAMAETPPFADLRSKIVPPLAWTTTIQR